MVMRAREMQAWLKAFAQKRIRRFRRRHRHLSGTSDLSLWHDSAYRLPVPALHTALGIDERRADQVASYLVDEDVVAPEHMRTPVPIGYEALLRVHTPELIESLQRPEALARILGVDPHEVRPVEILQTSRLACGATLAAAREVLGKEGPRHSLNLLGGFHHAAPDRASGLCFVNDIAVAVNELRRDGWDGMVAIIDVDAHPPDGTAACLANDPKTWIGSLSGADWGLLEGVDQTLIAGANDGAYLHALRALLRRMPKADLCFVIAGGDVLASDRLGDVNLTLNGARRRDLAVFEAVAHTPTVWLPGGGYSALAWQVLAGTALVITERTLDPIGAVDPLHTRFARMAARMNPSSLGASIEPDFDDVLIDLGMAPRQPRLLGYYTTEGIEHALARYGLIEVLKRRGFHEARVSIDKHNGYDRARLFAHKHGREHMLVEMLVKRDELDGLPVLYVEWLTLRDPTRSHRGPRFPGQDHPGLGLAREIGELLMQMGRRLDMRGVAFRPAWYHSAFAGRHHCRFHDPERHARFRALRRDTRGMGLREVSTALADGRVELNGEAYEWEADPMVHWLSDPPEQPKADDSAYRFLVKSPQPES